MVELLNRKDIEESIKDLDIHFLHRRDIEKTGVDRNVYINDANWKDVWFYSNGEILGLMGTIKVFFYDNLLLIITILGLGLFVGYKVSIIIKSR